MTDPETSYLKKELYELVQRDERIFDFIQSAALDGLWYWDLENPAEEWMNPRFWTVLGYDPDAMPHKSAAWKKLIHPEDLKVATENFARHCQDPNHPYDQNVRYTHRDGSTVWVRCRGLAIRDEHGKAVRMLGAHQDITNLKQKEEMLQETEARFNELAELSGTFAWEIDAAGCYTYLSPSVASVLGYTPEELVGRAHFYDLHPAAGREAFMAEAFEIMARRKPVKDYENQLVTKSGNVLLVSTNGLPMFGTDGTLLGYRGTDTDISQRKRDEDRLRTLGAIAESESMMVLVTDAERETEWANPTFWRTTGYQEREMIGKSPGTILQGPEPDEDLNKRMSEAFDAGEPFQCEILNYAKDGTPYWIYMDIQPVHDSKGVLTHFIGVQQEITERRAITRQLEATLYRLRIATQAGGIGVWEYLPDTNKLIWDQRMHQLFGIPEGSFTGIFEDWRRHVHPDDVQATEQAFQDALAGTRPFHTEFRVRHPELGLRYLTADAEVLRDDAGRPTHVYGVNQDITDRKQAEQGLLRQMDLQRQLRPLISSDASPGQTGSTFSNTIMSLPPAATPKNGAPKGWHPRKTTYRRSLSI